MALLHKRKVFAFAQEPTAGTAVALNTSNTCFCFDPQIQAEIPMHERVATGSLSRLPSVSGAMKGKITFSVELAGGSTLTTPAPEPLWAPLLRGCGMKDTTHVWTPTSNPGDYKTFTIGVYEDGRMKTICGAMGTFTIDAAKAGEPVHVKFEFTGIWVGVVPVEANIALPAYAQLPPKFANATFVIGDYTPKISKFSLESGNTVAMIEDVTRASGYNRAIVTGRHYKGKIDPMGELVATWDAYGNWLAGTTATLSMQLGSTINNTITLAAPALQIANIQEANRNDLITDDQDFVLTSSSAGDLEFSLTFA